MIARLRRSLREDEGFTLVELLVVIIIIGILSAVAVPVYLNQQKKAKDAAADSDVSTIGKQIQTALIDQGNPSLMSVMVNATSGHYMLTTGVSGEAAVDLGRASDGVLLVAAGTAVVAGTEAPVTALGGGKATAEDWCISVQHPDGKSESYRYSNTGGIEAGKTCKDAA
ncbi:MAG TPA: prepilin-type N-terminal cleavage/methylation domain-containing protein [Cellulomonas sp.]